MTKICSECGTKQDETSKYCKNCGALLSGENNVLLTGGENNNSNDVKTCPKCGCKQESFAKFCRNCGASLSGENIRSCEYCGAVLHDEAFCPDCGKPTGIMTCPKCGKKTVNEDFCPVCGYKVNQNIRVCANCGSKIDARNEICPNCGTKAIKKNPIVALALSLVFPGLGQFYNHQNHKGLVLIIAYIVSWILSLILIGVILVFLIWIYGMYDAFVSAKAINNGEILEDRLF